MPAKVPPVPVVRAVEAVRARVQRLAQRMVPGHVALLELSMAAMTTQAVHVAAELGLADVLADGPLPAAEIARRAGTDADCTERLLRLLASYSVFTEKDGRFELTSMGQALRTGVPLSMREMALLAGDPTEREHWSHLTDAVRTGKPVIATLRGMGGYEFLEANPDFARTFEGGMGNLSTLETEPILAGYDFSRYRTIVDIFGGGGALLAEILGRCPGSTGVLVDERAEMLDAAGVFAEAGVEDRATIDLTALLERPPAGGDAYLMKHILHEWPEAAALEVLRNVRSVMTAGSRLLVLEFVVPDDDRPHPSRLVDLWLMVLMGGKERTAKQYAELLARAGFRFERVVGTAAAVSVIEAVPV
jgi:hypothetical protein